MKYLASIPLFVLLLITYNIAAFMPSQPLSPEAAPLFELPLVSGAVWAASTGDLIILFGVALLYLELFKSTKTGPSTIVEHVLSMFVFIGFLLEFILVPAAGTSVFLILTMLSLVDVVAGFTITISTARRDFGFGHGG